MSLENVTKYLLGPGGKADVDDQGDLNTCTYHALAKANCNGFWEKKVDWGTS